jgi:hypothetical protein
MKIFRNPRDDWLTRLHSELDNKSYHNKTLARFAANQGFSISSNHRDKYCFTVFYDTSPSG